MRIGLRHLPDQIPDLGSDLGPPWSTALPSPIEAETRAMPTDHGLGLDQDERLVPGPPDPRQQHPESAVTRLQPRLLDGSSQDPDLVPQGEVLQDEGLA
jgi:hypothetical protein